MAIKKRGRKKTAPPPPKRGRKKELKRFEMETWYHGDGGVAVTLEANEIAFVIRTSGGTPLNTSDVKKLFSGLQHEIRALGHILKRKGQSLDPEPQKPKDHPLEEPVIHDDGPGPEKATGVDQANAGTIDTDHDNGTPNDPDDSDAHTKEMSTI